ncbi:hypothetical protein CBM2592_B180154 [Cupriavidus taiwanensis]|nr:hypothetical protein CBM2592_B180154 [Cupriavidus taiwanensis]SOY70137.1 hypothetical protein CBM2588_B210001 [Cupriavidus taiwanensis]SOY95395.1 hypothetical protein CBM2591_B170151 [Cupriavidus taiwanensis]SOZ72046.1 hypothetical protein CBM2617_B180362 [Cupriavidus taiwanensis]SOZ87327.1 hypothetical protein CBM2618_B200359 [Cupriavidus taiwanensis]
MQPSYSSKPLIHEMFHMARPYR